MTNTQQGLQRADSGTVRFEEALQAVRSYLADRFPVSQAGAVLSSYVCCYLLYGQVHGAHVFGWATVVGGVTVVLLALIRRIVDDAEDVGEDVGTGRIAPADGGERRLRGLVLGGLAATVLGGALNATCGLGLLAASVGVAAWFSLAMVIQNTAAVSKSSALQYLVVETCPAVLLLYGYVAWVEATGGSLPALAVIAIVGLFWATFQFWGFTRKMGTGDWVPWGLAVGEIRLTLLGVLALAAAFSIVIGRYAQLSIGFQIYGLALSGLFATLVLRWWAALPAGADPQRVDARWAGMPFGVAVGGGVLIAVLVTFL